MSGGTLTPGGDDKSYARLLAAVREEKPSQEARQRTLRALGLTAAVAASLAPVAAKKSVLAFWLKVFGGATGGVVIGLILWQGLAARVEGDGDLDSSSRGVSAPMQAPSSSTSSPAIAEQQASTAPVPIESLPRVASSERAGAIAVPPAQSAASKSSASPIAGDAPPAASAPSPADRLAAEVRALDEVRQALRSGAAANALALLDRYEKEFSAPTLGNEAQVLKIEALMRTGRSDAARAMASEYLRLWPNSPFSPKVRALTGMD